MNKWANIAEKYIGVPYKNGGLTRAGVDCVGLVVAVLREAGDLPEAVENRLKKQYSSIALNGELVRHLKTHTVPKTVPERGDLALFKLPRLANATHLAIYLGNDKLIHAHSGAGRVVITNTPSPEERIKIIYYGKKDG